MNEQANELAKGRCGSCLHLARVFGMAICDAWGEDGTSLAQKDGQAVRCFQCLNHGVNNKEQGED